MLRQTSSILGIVPSVERGSIAYTEVTILPLAHILPSISLHVSGDVLNDVLTYVKHKKFAEESLMLRRVIFFGNWIVSWGLF